MNIYLCFFYLSILYILLQKSGGAHTFSSAIHTIIIEKTSRNAPLYALAFSVFNLFFTKETKIFTSIYYLWRHYEYKRTWCQRISRRNQLGTGLKRRLSVCYDSCRLWIQYDWQTISEKCFWMQQNRSSDRSLLVLLCCQSWNGYSGSRRLSAHHS